jgi:hypothetical protein
VGLVALAWRPGPSLFWFSLRVAERVEQDGGTLPSFVIEELEGLLRCGDFEHGFVQLCCTRCGDELRVAFSCKGRGVCPSCIGRRMCETAANWVDGLRVGTDLESVPAR